MVTRSGRAKAERLASCVLFSVFLLLGGCTPTAYVEARAPVGVETYPRAYYDGHVVYWVGDRWYGQRNGVWFYYGTEPAPLFRYRSHVGYGPPRYYAPSRSYYGPSRYRTPRHYAPPSRMRAPPSRMRAPPSRMRAPPARGR